MTLVTLVRTIGAMARNVTVITTDDLDGSEGAAPVSFGIDGASYEIDLGPENRSRLESELAPFLAVARRAGSGSRRRGSGRPAPRSADRAAVRAWARQAGLQISERGRISADVLRQFEESH